MADVKWSSWSDDGTPTTGDLLVGLRAGVNVKFDPPTMTSLAGAPLVLAGSLTTTGAFAVDLTFTGITGVTFPTTGTLATTSQLPSTGTPLALNVGGTNADLTASAGSVAYSSSSAIAFSGVGTSGQLFQSAGTSAPGWTTATFPATAGTSGNVLVSNGTNWSSSSTTGITALGAQAQALNMNSNLIDNVTDPVNPQDAATKNYVDQTALNGTSVYAASTGTLGTVTQAGAGVGATLTNAGAQATFALDSVNPPVGSNVLIKNTSTGATAANEGIYTVTNVGSGSTNWVLTRATSYDTAIEINNTGLIVIQNGTTLSGTAWYNAATIVTVDTTSFSYSEFGNIVFPISLAHGGTNANLTASNGGIVYSGATSLAILAGTATAGLALLSGASTTPTWSTLPPITKVVKQVFTSGGTYTPTTGMKYCMVEAVGGGGGGGGCATAGASSGGGAGGGGGYGMALLTSAQISASQTVTIGAAGAAGSSAAGNGGTGGTTSLGTLLVVTGGAGGAGTTAVTSATYSASAAGGTATTADLAITGGVSSIGFSISTLVASSGAGGNSIWGGGGIGSLAGAGSSGTGFGGGGGGGAVLNGSASAAGGVGTAGAMYITEYCSV